MKKTLSWFGIAFVWMAMVSCIDNNNNQAEDELELLKTQTAEIDAYLATNGLTAVKDINGVRMVITKMGTGFPAHQTTPVDVDYTGRFFPKGSVFDSGTQSAKPPTTFIPGWQIALATLPEGSKATVYIPSLFGYGATGQGPIPGNSILEFDMNVKRVIRSSAELTRLGTDTVAIDTYLTSKGIEATNDTTGMRYVLGQTTGPKPGLYDRVSIHVAYKLLSDDSKIVGEYDLNPNEGTYNRVIDQTADGLKVGLRKMPVGSKATFYLPSLLGFGTLGAAEGPNGSNPIIPANANIIVEVTLNEIVNP